MSQTVVDSTHPSFRILAIGCGIGTALQFFNFTVYATAAALIFDQVFFVTKDLWFSTLLSSVVLTLGFVSGPIGAILFGHFGDRISRRRMLQLSITMMAVTSLLIAVLPTYAAIGLAAPATLVLLRIIDGIALGGEFGGAGTLIFEYAPADLRGRYGSVVTGATNAATFLAYGFFALLTLLPYNDLLTWGWRLPFIFGTTVAICGIIVRRKLADAPEFERLRTAGATARIPVLSLLRQHARTVLLTTGTTLGYFTLTGILLIFVLSYAPQKLGMSPTAVLVATVCGAATQTVSTVIAALLSDRFGRRSVMLTGTVFAALFSFPIFWLLQTKSFPVLVLTVCVGAVALGAVIGPMVAYFGELFSLSMRYTGIGLVTLIGSSGLGLATIIANRIVAATGGTAWISAYMLFMCLISVGCLVALPETRRASGSGAPAHTASATALLSPAWVEGRCCVG